MQDLHASIGYDVLGFLTALGGSLALTYVVREKARQAKLFDDPDSRKVHRGDIPRLGGVAVFASSMLALGLVLALDGSLWSPTGIMSRGLAPVLLGAAAIHFVGLYDDLKGLRARWKLAAQVVVALAVYAAGVRVTSVALPFFGSIHLLDGSGLLFTVLWLVGITNAFNLIDGLDGLASGAAMFALTTMYVVATMNQQHSAALLTITLAGATLGFLVYNYHPASIFLGDSGSMFLGFMLGGIGLLSSEKSPTVVAVAIPMVSLGLPVIDTVVSIVRRFLRGQPIFSADRGHIHHRLLTLGHSPRQATLRLYGACAMLALAAMILVDDAAYVALVLVLVGLVAILAIQRLRYDEFTELGRIIRKGVQQRAVIGRSVRIREASTRVATMATLPEVFTALGETFAADDFQRAEVRLRPSFLYGGTVASLDRRLDDDVSVWTWSRSNLSEPSLWEIKLPLMDPRGVRVGSLVMWQDGLSCETALSHMHTIARELRAVVERKVIDLVQDSELVDGLFDDGVDATSERVIPLAAVSDLHRRRDELAADATEVVIPERQTSGMRSHLR